MKILGIQSTLRFYKKTDIRRKSNLIEDRFFEEYDTPQILPIPDEFAPDIPRIILSSKKNHSQIILSQISAIISMNFEGDDIPYRETKDVIAGQMQKLSSVLSEIEIDKYLFCGLTYTFKFSQKNTSPIEYMKSQLANADFYGEPYDASWQTTSTQEDNIFINEKMGIFRKYEGQEGTIPDFMNFAGKKLEDEGIALSIDTNNRYAFLKTGKSREITKLASDIEHIYKFVDKRVSFWSGQDV